MKVLNNLNLLKFFTETLNSKTYSNRTKPVSISKLTPLRFSSSVNFINSIFDNFYYCFPLSGAATESCPRK